MGVFLFKKPNENNGTLDHLFLESVKAEPVMACVEEFWNCREKAFKEPPKKPVKAKSWTYCSAMPEPAYRVGVATTKGFRNLDVEALPPIKAFLEHFH